MKRKVILMTSVLTLCMGSIASAFNDVTPDKWYYREVMELNRRGIVKGYEDGTFRAESNVKSAEALAMVLRSVGIDNNINSVGANWADGIISTGVKEGIVDQDMFDRDREATREEVVAMIFKSLKLEEGDELESVFEDTSCTYVNTLYREGIIKGEFIDGKLYFNPERNISRAEMGALTIRVMESNELQGINPPKGEETDAKYFGFESATGTITSYSSDGPRNIVVPREINGVAVSRIGERAFASHNIESVELAEGLKSIGRYAFVGNKIRRLELPNSLESVEMYAFTGNEIVTIRIPGSISHIDGFAFSHNNLNSVEILNGVKSIGNFAFADNRIERIDFSNSLETIASGAFIGNNLSELNLPNGIVSVGERAFENNNLSRVTISDTVNNIGKSAFARNGLVESDVSLGLRFSEFWLYETYDKTRVRGHILGGNNGKLEIPNGVLTIGENAFYSSGLTDITIPNSVTSILEGAFYSNQLTNIDIPRSVKVIGASAFRANKLSEVRVPSSTSVVIDQDRETFDEGVKISRY